MVGSSSTDISDLCFVGYYLVSVIYKTTICQALWFLGKFPHSAQWSLMHLGYRT